MKAPKAPKGSKAPKVSGRKPRKRPVPQISIGCDEDDPRSSDSDTQRIDKLNLHLTFCVPLRIETYQGTTQRTFISLCDQLTYLKALPIDTISKIVREQINAQLINIEKTAESLTSAIHDLVEENRTLSRSRVPPAAAAIVVTTAIASEVTEPPSTTTKTKSDKRSRQKQRKMSPEDEAAITENEIAIVKLRDRLLECDQYSYSCGLAIDALLPQVSSACIGQEDARWIPDSIRSCSEQPLYERVSFACEGSLRYMYSTVEGLIYTDPSASSSRDPYAHLLQKCQPLKGARRSYDTILGRMLKTQKGMIPAVKSWIIATLMGNYTHCSAVSRPTLATRWSILSLLTNEVVPPIPAAFGSQHAYTSTDAWCEDVTDARQVFLGDLVKYCREVIEISIREYVISLVDTHTPVVAHWGTLMDYPKYRTEVLAVADTIRAYFRSNCGTGPKAALSLRNICIQPETKGTKPFEVGLNQKLEPMIQRVTKVSWRDPWKSFVSVLHCLHGKKNAPPEDIVWRTRYTKCPSSTCPSRNNNSNSNNSNAGDSKHSHTHNDSDLIPDTEYYSDMEGSDFDTDGESDASGSGDDAADDSMGVDDDWTNENIIGKVNTASSTLSNTDMDIKAIQSGSISATRTAKKAAAALADVHPDEVDRFKDRQSMLMSGLAQSRHAVTLRITVPHAKLLVNLCNRFARYACLDDAFDDIVKLYGAFGVPKHAIAWVQNMLNAYTACTGTQGSYLHVFNAFRAVYPYTYCLMHATALLLLRNRRTQLLHLPVEMLNAQLRAFEEQEVAGNRPGSRGREGAIFDIYSNLWICPTCMEPRSFVSTPEMPPKHAFALGLNGVITDLSTEHVYCAKAKLFAGSSCLTRELTRVPIVGMRVLLKNNSYRMCGQYACTQVFRFDPHLTIWNQRGASCWQCTVNEIRERIRRAKEASCIGNILSNPWCIVCGHSIAQHRESLMFLYASDTIVCKYHDRPYIRDAVRAEFKLQPGDSDAILMLPENRDRVRTVLLSKRKNEAAKRTRVSVRGGRRKAVFSRSRAHAAHFGFGK